MKSFTTKLMIAAAALSVAAGAASAQGLKADVPFAFHTGGAVMAAGTYKVTMDPSQTTVRIESTSGKHAVVALPQAQLSGGTAGEAKLVFSCDGGRCTLVQAWSGTPGNAYSFPRPKEREKEATLRVVRLTETRP